MTNQELEIINQAAAVRFVNLDKNVEVMKQAIKILFDEDLCINCPGDLKNAYNRINSHLNNIYVMKKTGTVRKHFELNDNTIVEYKGQMYSNFNLTDEVAAKMLAENPKWHGRFKRISEETIKQLQKTESLKADETTDEQGEETVTTDQQNADTIAALDAADRAGLQEIARSNGLPEKKWLRLDEVKLRSYLKKELA